MNLFERVNKIATPEDAEHQIRLAKAYVVRLRSEAKKKSTLAEKIAMNEKVKAADQTLRKIRSLIFDIEDALAAGKPATSVL